MRKVLISITVALVFGIVALTLPGASVAANPITEVSLSDPSALTTQTQSYSDKSGDYTMTTTVSPDSTAALALGSDGYPCADVGYNATQKWYDIWGIVLWTYHSHFGVHVCHNKVQKVISLYDEPTSSTLGWGWCGNVVRQQLNTLPYSSGRSYTKGCFNVFSKIGETRYPWARMTIGGNGGLWARSTGVD